MRIAVTIITVASLLMLVGACANDVEPADTDEQTAEEPQADTSEGLAATARYAVVDTGQTIFFNATSEIDRPELGEAFFGQDAQYMGNAPSYTDNGDGTVTDNVTGLMWEQDFRTVRFDDAAADAAAATTGGYDDWRVPTIKELYSLILFTGNQGTGPPDSATAPSDAVPFLDTDVFNFEYSPVGRYIDAQCISATRYTSTTMGGNETFFGVNFADGRIKGYPTAGNPQNPEFTARYVRGGEGYGVNDFDDNGDGTVTDNATGLMWVTADSGDGLDWQDALAYAEDLSLAGHDDWRLPNAKELHTIVDYSRAPDVTDSAAIDPVFEVTPIENEAGQTDWAQYWTSTTFMPGRDAIYICFGRGLGYFSVRGAAEVFMDVHGAGAQRTDPKIGEPSYGNGPQGDVRRIYNYVRVVRDVE